MGGKKGNRTKGNTRPSSSGRTAEMLSASGVTGFVGFTGLATEVPGFLSLGATDDLESTVDSDFRMVMKKATKRDSVTRVKALQEFSDLCQSKTQNAVKGALPYWPRLFVKLAVDHDRRVREATHQANKHLVTNVKKDLAPYLKSMMGTWVVSMCDSYPPASSAAQEAFQVAFPASKQPEALEYCKDEIFNFILDVLFQQTAQTLSDVSTSSPEEVNSKYIRLVASSLKALKLFITTVTDLKKEKTVQYVTEILENNKFWKYANHKEVEIQISWYLFISSFCQHMPELSSKYALKLAPLTLGHIDETQPIVASLIWESILHLLVTVENCWQYVNVQKAVIPQLWKLLRNGGKGNADSTFKNLLPFLSKIPLDIMGPKIAFFTNLFDSFKQGVLNDRVQNSPSELKAVIQAFLECFLFVLFHRLSFDTDSDERDTRVALVKDHLLPLIEQTVLDLNCHIQKAFFAELGVFIKAVESQSAQIENADLSIAAKTVLDLFWNTIFDTFNKVLVVTENDGADIKLKRFAQLIQNLYDGESNKKTRKVAFTKEPEKEELLENLHKQDNYPRKTLMENIHKLCSRLLETMKSTPHALHLKFLSEIIQTVSSKELFTDLVQEYFVTDASRNGETVEKFIKEVILHWLENRETIFGKAEYIVPSLLGILLHACTCIPQEKAFVILNDQCSVQDISVLENLISKLISKQFEMPTLFAWLKSEELGKSLVSLATKIGELIGSYCENPTLHESWKLLKICFTATKDFEPLINVQYLNEILTVLTSVLLNQPANLESSTAVVSFVCELAQSLLTSCLGCYQLTAVEDLLVCLFELNCTNKFLSSDSQDHVRNTWCMGTEQLVKFQHGFLKDNGFFCKATQTIQDSFLRNNFQYSQLSDLSVTEHNALYLLQNVASHLPETENVSFLDKTCLVRVLIDKMLPSKELISKLQADLSENALNSRPYKLEVPLTQILYPTEEVHPLVKVVRFLVKVLNEFVCKSVSVEKGELSEDTKEFLIDNLTTICLVVAYGNSLFIRPEIENSSEITQMFLEISNAVSNIQCYVKTEDVIRIASSLVKSESVNNKLFLLVFSKVLSTFQPQLLTLQEFVEPYLTAAKADLSSSNSSNLDTAMYLIPCASEETIKILFEHASCVISSEDTLGDKLSNQYFATLVCCLQNTQFNKLDIEHVKNVFKYLQTMKSQSDIRLLCEVQITAHHESEVEFSTIVSDLMCLFLNASQDAQELWILDLIMCTLCGWVNTLSKSTAILNSKQDNVIFARNVFQLLTLVKNYIAKDMVKQHSPDLINEWRDLYFPTIFSQVLALFFKICEGGSKNDHKTWEDEQLFNSLSTSLYNLPTEDLVNCITNSALHPEKEIDVIGITDRLYSLLISDIPAVQWCTHNILNELMPNVAEVSSKDATKELDDGNTDGSQRSPPLPVAKILDLSGQIVDTMLSEFHVEDCCMVEPFTDSYIYTLTYLLSWLHMLNIFSCSTSEVRSEYALNFQCSKLLDSLLLNVFRLMPNNPVILEKRTMFTESYHPENSSSPSGKLIQKVACHVYLNTLSQLPALVRHWWNKQDKRTADYVNKFTTTFVSGLISLEEVKSVQDTKVQFNNMTVKARPAAREVVAMYTMEDITIELLIRLPQNHPLGPVSVETGQRIGVSVTQWRHWMLQLTTFLTHQNGSILDALSLWKRNVDKRFEGVEECMICFYVLHGATCQLPRLTCKTCKKKFHSACLYKWFSTSQNASCPLCRNLF